MKRLMLIWLLAPCIAAAQNSLVGHWVGQVKPERAKMMKAAKLPEHVELLSYALDRLERSTVTVDLLADGTFKYFFDDGYREDQVHIRGTWKATPTAVIITIGALKKHSESMPLTDGGKHFTTTYNDIDTVPIIFSRG
jgi:hypothetical protein